MTNIYEEYEEVETNYKFIKKICDWCGEEIPRIGSYDFRDFDLEYGEGSSYPESGNKVGWEVEDLCDVCVPKLRAFLEENGVTIKETDIDW